MRKIAFTTIISLACLFMMAGCKSTSSSDCGNCTPTTKQGLFGSFADEHYIWEDFIFSTNRIDNVK